jgi:hypothetical protein
MAKLLFKSELLIIQVFKTQHTIQFKNTNYLNLQYK